MNEKQLDVQVCVNVRIIWGGIYMRFEQKRESHRKVERLTREELSSSSQQTRYGRMGGEERE